MQKLIPTIGLEIHAELKTKSKMFCGCANSPDESEVNAHICPVCMAHPGTLPVINKEAVRHVLRVGVAIGGMLADFTEFDRKNYFYPDIPKGYQISQYKFPLVSGGEIGGVAITRIHLEEDTARSIHQEDASIVDYNRAGVPLMELVTEPVIHDPNTAVSFARDLMLLLRYLNASEANLEKGEMRIEANISLAPEGAPLGTKVEVKNLNSFKAVEQAIAYEIRRHTDVLTRNDVITQETRGWDENKQRTFSQRKKENSDDYRYFPDPDLPKLRISEIPEFEKSVLEDTLPELPWEVRARYTDAGMKEQHVELFVTNVELNTFYTQVLAHVDDEKQRKLSVNYITSDVVGMMSKPDYKGRKMHDLEPKEFACLMKMIAEGKVSSRGGKDVLGTWLVEGGDVQKIAKDIGVLQVSDAKVLQTVVDQVIQENQNAVEEYRAGKTSSLQFLVGQGMRLTKGSANPTLLSEMLEKAIR